MSEYDRKTVLTASSIQSFERCPRMFHALYRGNPETLLADSAESRRGTLIHETLCRHALGMPWGENRTATMAHGQTDDMDELAALLERVEVLYGNPPELFFGTPDIIAPEKVFYLGEKGQPCDPVDAAFAGTIDLLLLQDETVTVRDYKSGRNIDFKSPLENNWQLRCYGYAAALLFQEAAEIVLEIHALRFDGNPQPAILDWEALSGVWSEIAARCKPIFQAIEAEDFPTRPNEFCAWCQARNTCPAWSMALTAAPQGLPARSDIPRLWAAMALVESKIKEIKEAIRHEIEENGPIAGDDGKVLDIYATSRDVVDPIRARRILEGYGEETAEIDAAMKMTKGDLLNFARGRDKASREKKAALLAAIKEEPGTRLEWR